jgi:hypothetical protein
MQGGTEKVALDYDVVVWGLVTREEFGCGAGLVREMEWIVPEWVCHYDQ